MFISQVKSKGNYYFYAYIYDKSKESGLRTVYSLGKKESALSLISSWNEKKSIPTELSYLGLRMENLDKWKMKLEGF